MRTSPVAYLHLHNPRARCEHRRLLFYLFKGPLRAMRTSPVAFYEGSGAKTFTGAKTRVPGANAFTGTNTFAQVPEAKTFAKAQEDENANGLPALVSFFTTAPTLVSSLI